jgi:phosphoribosyl 1,2-cyclic phosphate phosphodiesterase
MRVTFLGTGTSHGVPMIGCRCATCTSDDPRDRRFRPSILIQTDDGTAVLVDTATDLRLQALWFGVTRVDAILFTHSHADHILGLDDVRRFNALQGGSIPAYADEGSAGDIRRTFSYIFDAGSPRGAPRRARGDLSPSTGSGLPERVEGSSSKAGSLPQIDLRVANGPIALGGATFVPVPIEHGGRPILGYRVGAFAYLTDCSRIPDASWPLLDGVDAVVLDALRDRPHPTHFTLAEAVEAARHIGASRVWFTHMAHDLAHEPTCARLPAGMELAYDGLVIIV